MNIVKKNKVSWAPVDFLFIQLSWWIFKEILGVLKSQWRGMGECSD